MLRKQFIDAVTTKTSVPNPVQDRSIPHFQKLFPETSFNTILPPTSLTPQLSLFMTFPVKYLMTQTFVSGPTGRM
jgi:hypothetical protein